jgi:hypothetical protein
MRKLALLSTLAVAWCLLASAPADAFRGGFYGGGFYGGGFYGGGFYGGWRHAGWGYRGWGYPTWGRATPALGLGYQAVSPWQGYDGYQPTGYGDTYYYPYSYGYGACPPRYNCGYIPYGVYGY